MEENTNKQNTAGFSITPAKLILVCVAGLVLLALLFCLVLYGVTGHFFPRANNLQNKDNYSFDEEALENSGGLNSFRNKMNKAVAAYGDHTLTNGMLQIYYWEQVDKQGMEGPDYTKPLHSQIQDPKTGLTWQQYFLREAIETWRGQVALTIAGKAAGYAMPQEYATQFQTLEADLKELAESRAYSDIQSYIDEQIAYGASYEDYYNYLWLSYYSSLYFQEQKDTLQITQQQLEQYFTDHEQELLAADITKESGKLVDVRHILLKLDSNNFSEEAFAECYTRAQMILSLWEKGARDEDSFAELAREWSTDSYSKNNGGLYEKIYAGQMESKEFDQWCFSDQRKPGDCEIITTELGCHVMYFVAGSTVWEHACRQGVLSQWSENRMEELLSTVQPKVNYRAIVLGPKI